MKLILSLMFFFCLPIFAGPLAPSKWTKPEVIWSAPAELRDLALNGFSKWQSALNNVMIFREATLVEIPDIVFVMREDLVLSSPGLTGIAYTSRTPTNGPLTSVKILVLRPDYFLLDAIITHEIGHALGLEHSPNPDSIMYYAPAFHDLHRVDIESICFLYGTSPLVPEFGLTATRIKKSKKFNLHANRFGEWVSDQMIKIRKVWCPRFDSKGADLVCTVSKYPYILHFTSRGYTVDLTIENPNKNK